MRVFSLIVLAAASLIPVLADAQTTGCGNSNFALTNNTAVINAAQSEGGRWIPDFDPSAIVQAPWGMLTFSFTDCNHGRVDFMAADVYTFGVGSGHMDLTRLTQPAGLTCP